MKIFLKIILSVIGFPQHILGFLVWLFLCKKIVEKETIGVATVYWVGNWNYGVSLGTMIFLGTIYKTTKDAGETTKKHEYGHTIQSVILGPLYLIIVGIPSITFNIISRLSNEFGKDYYKRYPENWADKISGIKREGVI